jgi:hypothetical protein
MDVGFARTLDRINRLCRTVCQGQSGAGNHGRLQELAARMRRSQISGNTIQVHGYSPVDTKNILIIWE